MTTAGFGQGKVGWGNYEVTVSPGWAKKDTIGVDADPRRTWNKPATVSVVSAHQREVTWQGTLPARYDCAFVADLRGGTGDWGTAGSGGRDGNDGGSGRNGDDGADGRRGERGQEVDVWLTTVHSNGADILQAKVAASMGVARYYAFDARSGSLTVDASGGKGGTGGTGGGGGDGGNGENPGDGGDGGDGGEGGDGGDGGEVTIHVSPKAERHAERLIVVVEGGPGGDGGSAGSAGSAGKGANGSRGRKGRFGVRGEEGRTGRRGSLRQVVEPVVALW